MHLPPDSRASLSSACTVITSVPAGFSSSTIGAYSGHFENVGLWLWSSCCEQRAWEISIDAISFPRLYQIEKGNNLKGNKLLQFLYLRSIIPGGWRSIIIVQHALTFLMDEKKNLNEWMNQENRDLRLNIKELQVQRWHHISYTVIYCIKEKENEHDQTSRRNRIKQFILCYIWSGWVAKGCGMRVE